MTKEEFYKLLDRYLSGSADNKDERYLNRFSEHLTGQHKQELFVSTHEKEVIYQRLLSGVSKNINKAKRRQRIQLAMKAAASLFLLVSIGTVAYLSTNTRIDKAPSYITFSTKNGEHKTVTLNDGSVVMLNGGSTLTYPATFAGVRNVMLEGEAFFRVTKDSTLPFVVMSGHFSTTVLGTSFDIKAYRNEPQSVTVATGKVLVKTMGHAAQLRPDQRVEIGNDNSMATAHVHAADIYSWMNNSIVLRKTSLQELTGMLERQYGIAFVLANPALKNCKFTGRFDNSSLDEVLESLKYMNGIGYKYRNKDTIELTGACKGPIQNSSAERTN